VREKENVMEPQSVSKEGERKGDVKAWRDGLGGKASRERRTRWRDGLGGKASRERMD
jgi:hypothetical protein